MDKVLLTKFASLEKCIKRVREEYVACEGDIEHDILRQDSILLNLERACEQCLSMGQRMIRLKKLGLPKEYRDIFIVLKEAKIISEELSERLQRMVGFRNVAIHDYQALDFERIKWIIEKGVDDLLTFGKITIEVV